MHTNTRLGNVGRVEKLKRRYNGWGLAKGDVHHSAAFGTNRPGRAIYNHCCALLTCRANPSSSPANDILSMSSVMLELGSGEGLLFAPFCLQVLPVAFDISIRSKTNVSRVEGKQPAYSFLFFSYFFFFLEVVGAYK